MKSDKPLVIAYIEWDDAQYDDGDYPYQEIEDLGLAENLTAVGLLVKEDNKCVTIALQHGYDEEDYFRFLLHIPTSCITKFIKKPFPEIFSK